ncbi:MAG: S8 family serine peptidase [Oligoflexia bacterium]|nr:S8 family serine peptidase [Oligoflexia bacterium]
MMRRVVLILLALTWIVHDGQAAYAENGMQCYSGQLIFTADGESAAELAKIQRAVDRVGDVDSSPIDKTAHLVLLSVDSGGSPADSLIPADEATDICSDLKRARREAIADARSGEALDVTVARRFKCGCNGEISILGQRYYDGAKGPTYVPNDYSASLWGMSQANDVDIDAPEAWSISTGNNNAVVAVIDTGVDYNHPDLQANVWDNPFEIAGDGIDNDSNGFVDDIHGANMVSNNGNPLDDNGHGSHCSGTIGGRGDNGIGVVGVNWTTKIMAVKMLSSGGGGSLYDGARAIDYVTNMKNRGVNVVLSSNSWGWYGTYFDVNVYYAIDRARQAGIGFVAAAGNNASNDDAASTPDKGYPAGYDLANIVSVAAVAENGTLAYFSNYGVTSVDIGAPGTNIYSTWPGNSYKWLNGTSMATPHVSGALMLLKAVNPALTFAQMKDLLFTYGKPLAALSGKTTTGKLLNVNNMLVNAGTPPPGWTPAATPTPLPTNTPTAVPTSTPTPLPTATATATPTPVPVFGAVSGTILADDGRPLSGVRVEVMTRDYQTLGVKLTDAQGRYSIPSIEGPKLYWVRATLSGYTFGGDFSLYHGGTSQVDFLGVRSAYRLNGLVVNPDKSPLAGVAVDAGTLGTAVSDADGKFGFDVPMNFKYQLNVSKSGYVFDYPRRSGQVYGNLTRVFVGSTQ